MRKTTKFDPTRPMNVAFYGRKSSDQQNPRSCEQQNDTVRTLIDRLKYPWTIVAEYRDDGISGRYTKKRPSFQQLLKDVKSGKLQIQAIVVDTIERFSRARDGLAIRKQFEKLGVLVLCAYTNFSDPTTTTGEIQAVLESVRAKEDGDIKAHNVLRGKRDAAKQKHWPGGAPPLGYKLKVVLSEKNGSQEFDHKTLEPHPTDSWIVQLMFQLADEHGHGSAKIAQLLNENPSIPQELKPMLSSTVGYCLANPIYYGELVWERLWTDVEDDSKISGLNPEAEWTRVPEFCEPLVNREVFERVNSVRRERAKRLADGRAGKRQNNSDRPRQGMVLRYPLTGLVRCADCKRAMTPSSGSEYVTKTGDRRRYVHYVCPGRSSGACGNKISVSETWLRQVVFSLVRQRLFGE